MTQAMDIEVIEGMVENPDQPEYEDMFPAFEMPEMEIEETPKGYAITDTTTIDERPDGSYVLDNIYHVPNTEEFAEEYGRIATLAAEQPDRVNVLPAPTTAELLANAKAAKLVELARAFAGAEQNGVINSGAAGFAIDANERANRDINGLITVLEASGDDNGTVLFCAADNTFHEVTLATLKSMLLEIIQYGQALYAKKWEIREAIEKAKTVKAVDAIETSFGK